jgi:hypothetical protein
MTFTTMVWFSIFHVFNAPSDERSAFVGLFTKQMAVGIDPPGNHVTGSGDLYTLSAAGVFNRAAHTRRLVVLHWCGEFGSLAA